MTEDIVWIFLHPPRAAGNTLIEAILNKYPREEILLPSRTRYNLETKKFDPNKIKFILGHATYYGIHKLVLNKQPRYFTIIREPASRLVSHYNFKMQEEKKRIPFEEWYNNQIKNEMVHFLDLKYNGSESSRLRVPKFLVPILGKLGYKTIYSLQTLAFRIFGLNKQNPKKDLKKLENAKKLLNLCWFVGIAEKSDEDFKFLLSAMGIKNPKWKNDGVSKKIFIKVDDKLRKKIYEDNPLDLELYNYALELREKKIKLIKKFFAQ